VEIQAPYYLVVASAGGFPLDIDLRQAHKGLENACQALRPGGTILFYAECPNGAGIRSFEDYVRLYRDDHEIQEALAREFVVGGHKAYWVARLGRLYEVRLVSGLDPDFVRRCHFVPVPPEEHQAVLQDLLREATRARAWPCSPMRDSRYPRLPLRRVEAFFNYRRRAFGDTVAVQFLPADPLHSGGVVCRAGLTAARTAQVVDEHVVILRPSVRVAHDSLEDLYGSNDFDLQAGFFADLAADGLLQRFTGFDYPARQRPVTLQGLVPAFHQQDAVIPEDQCADSEDGAIRIVPVTCHVSSVYSSAQRQ